MFGLGFLFFLEKKTRFFHVFFVPSERRVLREREGDKGEVARSTCACIILEATKAMHACVGEYITMTRQTRK